MALDFIKNYARQLGPLRIGLLAIAVLALIFIPTPGTRAVYSGWPLVTTVLIPVLTPMLFLVLLLDALMARVFLADAGDTARTRLKRIMLLNLLLAIALVARWLPFYAAVRV